MTDWWQPLPAPRRPPAGAALSGALTIAERLRASAFEYDTMGVHCASWIGPEYLPRARTRYRGAVARARRGRTGCVRWSIHPVRSGRRRGRARQPGGSHSPCIGSVRSLGAQHMRVSRRSCWTSNSGVMPGNRTRSRNAGAGAGAPSGRRWYSSTHPVHRAATSCVRCWRRHRWSCSARVPPPPSRGRSGSGSRWTVWRSRADSWARRCHTSIPPGASRGHVAARARLFMQLSRQGVRSLPDRLRVRGGCRGGRPRRSASTHRWRTACCDAWSCAPARA